jgi:hypothetical protein
MRNACTPSGSHRPVPRRLGGRSRRRRAAACGALASGVMPIWRGSSVPRRGRRGARARVRSAADRGPPGFSACSDRQHRARSRAAVLLGRQELKREPLRRHRPDVVSILAHVQIHHSGTSRGPDSTASIWPWCHQRWIASSCSKSRDPRGAATEDNLPPPGGTGWPVETQNPARAGSPRGVSEGTRTPDRLDHNQELYQLSYAHRGTRSVAVGMTTRPGGAAPRAGRPR